MKHILPVFLCLFLLLVLAACTNVSPIEPGVSRNLARAAAVGGRLQHARLRTGAAPTRCCGNINGAGNNSYLASNVHDRFIF